MKSNNKMQPLETCEICIQDRELVEEIVRLKEEIVRLKEHVSWLDSEILDLETASKFWSRIISL